MKGVEHESELDHFTLLESSLVRGTAVAGNAYYLCDSYVAANSPTSHIWNCYISRKSRLERMKSSGYLQSLIFAQRRDCLADFCSAALHTLILSQDFSLK